MSDTPISRAERRRQEKEAMRHVTRPDSAKGQRKQRRVTAAMKAAAEEADLKLRAGLWVKVDDIAPYLSAGDDEQACPICAAPFKAGDICATDIELGECHVACLEGSPVVNLNTGEPTDGPATTYSYEALDGHEAEGSPSPPAPSSGALEALREVRRRLLAYNWDAASDTIKFIDAALAQPAEAERAEPQEGDTDGL